MLKADFHIHTGFSMDSSMTPEMVIERCREMGINCIAVADHGTADGGLVLKKLAPFPVIVAEEVLTDHGEVMGMFLEETVPSGIAFADAIARIKEQGGLVCLPHPFDTFRGLRIDMRELESYAGQIDVIEVFNARSTFQRDSARALAFARKHDIACSAGSDSHTPEEIGHTYVEMPEFTGRDGFLAALRQGKIVSHKSSFAVHFGSTWARLKRSFM